MKFEITTDEGAGPVKFGMTPDEVRKVVKSKHEVGMRGEDDGSHPHDYFKKLRCFVYYDRSGKAEAIEFADSEPTLGGKNLLGLGYGELVKHIKKLDPEVTMEPEGFQSTKLGVGCYAPMGKYEPEKPAEGIIVFRRGYYDK